MTLDEYLQKHYRPGSVPGYRSDIAMYIAACPHAQGATYQEILRYVGALRDRYSNPRTVSRMVSSIKAYYQYLCDAELRKDNPTIAIRLMHKCRRDVQLQDLLSREQLEGLLNRKPRYKDHDQRHKVMMGLLVYQALLPVEIVAVETGDIDLKEGIIRVRGSGVTNGRELPLKSAQVLLLQEWLQVTRVKLLGAGTTNSLLIRSSGKAMSKIEIGQQVIRSYKNRYAPIKVNAQTIRQSVIADLLKQGHDISVVQLFAGHKLPDATERYKPGVVDSLRTALQKYHPQQ